MVVSRLNTKLIRDIKASPLMFAGTTFLLLIGIALYGSSYALFLNLKSSYALSYKELALADFSIAVQSAPTGITYALRRIPGVDIVEGRIIQEVEIELPGAGNQRAIGRIISLPDTGTPEVNKLKIITGSYPQMYNSREIMLEASFAKYHNYKPGDFLNIKVDEENLKFRIVGIVQSPEYVYVVRGSEYSMPTPRTFGVMWMRKAMSDELFGTSGAVNELSFIMQPNGNRRTAIRIAQRMLDPYGAADAVKQEDQASVNLLKQDMLGLQRLAIFFPILFMTISGLSVYNMLNRIIYAQRAQIGFLRAVGFSRRAIGIHYSLFALAIGGTGGLIGSAGGYYLGVIITRWYTMFIQVPYFDVSPRWTVIVGGFILASGVTLFSGIFPASNAAKMRPAEAIAAEVPIAGRGVIIERYFPFLSRIPLLGRLPLRNFLRNPRRTLSTVAGVASGVTLLLVSSGLLDSSLAAINFYFDNSVHYDILASYLHPTKAFDMERIERWKGVERVEPLLALPARIVKNNESQTILIYGIQPDSRLLSLTSASGERVPIEPTGVMVAGSTARKLHLWTGATVEISLPEQTVPEIPDTVVPQSNIPSVRLAQKLAQPTFRETVFSDSRALYETKMNRLARVSSVTYQPIGSTGYASIAEVRNWYRDALELPPNAINAVAITVDPKYSKSVERELYKLDGIASVEVIKDIRSEIDELLKQSQTFFNIMLAFSVALAGIIIFNSTLMNVIERTREIATLRTVGLSVRAAAKMIWIENLLSFVVGVIIGLPFGTWLASIFVQAYQSESFSMSTVIFTRTYLVTIFGILATVAIAQIPGIRYIRKIELTRATKDIG